MKVKFNKKSDAIYVNKTVYVALFNISKIDAIDDDCNECVLTIKGKTTTGYVSPKDLVILDTEKYDRDSWDEMIRETHFNVIPEVRGYRS